MLIILIPHSVVYFIIHKLIDTLAMLLVLKPLAVVAITVGKGIYTVSFTFSFDLLSFIYFTIFVYRLSFTVVFTSFNHAGVYGTVLKRIGSYFYFRRESPFYFIEEAAFFLGCGIAL